jgi:predicted DNA-binding transcriptional regulator AlpA
VPKGRILRSTIAANCSDAERVLTVEPKNTLRKADSRMVVQLSVEELRAIFADIVDERLKARLANGKPNGLLTAEQAADFLGYSKDWVYKNWQKIGGKKIGGRGLRFDAAELQAWVDSRR